MNSSGNILRKDFLKNSASAMAGFTVTPHVMGSVSVFSNGKISTDAKLILKNVRLENVFEIRRR